MFLVCFKYLLYTYLFYITLNVRIVILIILHELKKIIKTIVLIYKDKKIQNLK